MPKNGIEHQGLLQPESFDLDDLESAETQLETQNGHAKRPGEDWSRSRKTWSSAPPWLRPRYVIVALVTIATLLLVGIALNKGTNFGRNKKPSPERPPVEIPSPDPSTPPESEVKQWSKPDDFQIIGLIFFGRPPVVAILDCYLKKNLVTNGGWLDEVHFVVNTDREDDIKYLDELIKTNDLYKKIIIKELGYNAVWANAVEREHMYIKIDDDIVSNSITR